MSFMSKDLVAKAKQENAAKLAAAFKSGDEAQMEAALAGFCNDVHDAVLHQAAEDVAILNGDNAAMAARGYHVLTSAEMAYYNKMTEEIRKDPQAALTGWSEPMPVTIIDGVIESIRKTHPLLDKLDFKNVAYMTKIVLAKNITGMATWGPVTSQVKDEITGALEVLDLTVCKLSAFMAISNDILELGPQWMDLFIRETLAEVIATALEVGIITGDGKDKPIGMIMNISEEAGVHGGAYSPMAAIPLTEMTPESMGALVAKLARDPMDPTKARPIGKDDLLFIVNPFDYWGKLYGATSFRRPDGSYAHDVLPIPADLEQSAALTQGKAVLGLASRYIIGLGNSNKKGTITRDESVRFLEDETAVKAILRGNARPKDEYAFLYLDISQLQATLPILTKSADPKSTDPKV